MRFLSDATSYLPIRIALLLLFVALIWRSRFRQEAIIGLLAFLVSNELCDFFKATFRGLRPSVELVDTIVRVEGGRGFGSVSAHSANMMAVAFAFGLKDWRVGVPIAVLALLVGISRIYNGVHYPSQVLLGWMLGATVATVMTLIARKWTTAKRPSEPSDPNGQASPSGDLPS